MKKLLVSLLVCSLSFGALLAGKEGIEAYNKVRDTAFIQQLFATEKAEMQSANRILDYDSESPAMEVTPAMKKQMRADLLQQLPKEAHGQIDEFIQQMDGIRIEKQKIYIYCIDGKPVGYVRMFLIQGMGSLQEIAVAQEYRHKGIGGKLLKQAVAEFKKLKAGVIVVQIKESNKFAQKLYTKAGFIKQGSKDGYGVFMLQLAA